MKIDDGLRNMIAAMAKDLKKPASTANGTDLNSDVTDRVSISGAATNADEIRLDKIEAIRQKLAEGKYNISGSDVARKVLESLKN